VEASKMKQGMGVTWKMKQADLKQSHEKMTKIIVVRI
jgi:hypothetical protein